MHARSWVLSVFMLGAAAPAMAQSFDYRRYTALAEECAAFHEAAHLAVTNGEPGMALVYLDLGGDPCTSAWMMLSDDHALPEPEWTALAGEALNRDASRAELLAALGECEEGRTLLGSTGWLVERLPEASLDAYARATHAVLRCLPQDGADAAETLQLGPESASWWMSGVTRGVEDANARFGGTCVGYIPLGPAWLLELTAPGDVAVEVVADNDLTLVLSGPDGVLCNDDLHGLSPGLTATLSAGRHEVYVGEYLGTPTGSQFSINFEWSEPGSSAVPADPGYGVATVSPTGVAERLPGYTFGVLSATRFGASCAGLTSEAPSHLLQVLEESHVTIRVNPLYDNPRLSLVVANATGTWCDANADGGPTEVAADLAAGVYEVYVAELSPWGSGYDVEFQANPLATATPGPTTPPGPTPPGPTPPGPTTAPTAVAPAGDVVSGLGVGEIRSVGGMLMPVRVAETVVSGCPGYVEEAPQVTLLVTERGRYAIMATSEENDLVLAVVGPAMTACNDDWGGVNPGIFRELEPGTYLVYVGAWGLEAVGYELRIGRE